MRKVNILYNLFSNFLNLKYNKREPNSSHLPMYSPNSLNHKTWMKALISHDDRRTNQNAWIWFLFLVYHRLNLHCLTGINPFKKNYSFIKLASRNLGTESKSLYKFSPFLSLWKICPQQMGARGAFFLVASLPDCLLWQRMTQIKATLSPTTITSYTVWLKQDDLCNSSLYYVSLSSDWSIDEP